MPNRPAALLAPGFRAFVPLALVMALAACVPPAPEPTPVPSPAPSPIASATPTPTPAPVAAPAPANWLDAPQTPGDWHWRREGSSSIAEFTGQGGQLLLQISCTGQRQVTLSRVGGSAGTLTVQTETATRALPASASGAFAQASFAASDPLLDAIAFSRGRFAVSATGQPTLYVPAWPEITRVVEDCRG